MLSELVMMLVEADNDPKEKERAYRWLEKVGVDRMTADVMAAEFYERKDEQNGHGKAYLD